MKKYLFFLTTLAIVFMVSSCKQNGKTNDADSTNDSTSVADSTAVEEEKPNLDYNTTDAKTFGLNGCVAKVVTTTFMATLEGDKLVKGIVSNRTDSLTTFDEKGRVTLDSYANPYVYDADGKFIKGRSKESKMTRDKEGRITNYSNRENANHWEGYDYSFEYDKQGRINSIEWAGWEEGESYALTYKDDQLYPSSMHIDGVACADIYKTIEREMYFDVMQTTEAYEGNENPAKDYSKEYYIQERTITYY